MRAILGVTLEPAGWQFVDCEPRRCTSRRCRRQDDDGCQLISVPENSDLVSAPIRVRQEIVTPSAARDPLSRHRHGLEFLCRGSGTRGCGAGTPRRGLRVPFQRHNHSRLLTANHPSTWPHSFNVTANLLHFIRKLYRFGNVCRARNQHWVMPKPDWPFPVLSPLATSAMHEADHDSLARSASARAPNGCHRFAGRDRAPVPDRASVRHAQPLPKARPRRPHQAAEDRLSCASGHTRSSSRLWAAGREILAPSWMCRPWQCMAATLYGEQISRRLARSR